MFKKSFFVISLLRYYGMSLLRDIVITGFVITGFPYDSGLNGIVARCSALRRAMS